MSSPLRFLVVDALPGVQTFARQLLQSYGFTTDSILCCADTEAALAQGLLFKPQFLLTDWFAKAPLTGLQLHQRLLDAQPPLQLALLSFDVTPSHEAEARTRGAHFLLRKPFKAELLAAEMAQALGKRVSTSPGRAGGLATHATQRPVLPPLPPQPVIKSGDRVRYQGAVHVAQHIVHRHGGTVVQLQGRAEFVPVDKLTPA